MPYREIDRVDLFDVLPTPLMVLDRELRYVDMNEAYLAVTGRTRAQLLGVHVFDAFPESGDRLALFRDAFERALRGEANTLVETPFSIAAGVADGEDVRETYWTCSHAPVHNRAGEIAFVVQHAVDVTERVLMAQRNRMLSRELDHRVNNLLAVVASIGRRSARGAMSIDEFLEKLNARLESIARTHATLAELEWDGMSLRRLVEDELRQALQESQNEIAISGPSLYLSPKFAQALSMTVHELAINAAKYGALASPVGRLSVTWECDGPDRECLFEWRESGLTGIQKPEKEGFGSLVIDEVTAVQVGAAVERRYEPSGFVCTIRFLAPSKASD